MKVVSYYCSLFLFCVGYIALQAQSKPLERFSKEITELKDFFHIPGMAVIVEKDAEIILEEYLGFSDLKDSIAVDKSTAFPIASLTKIFSGVLLLKSLEAGKISLDTPINEYLSNRPLGDSILIKHILTHTSQGRPGEKFHYSYRFGALTPVIERAYGTSYDEAITTHIFNPLEMNDSWFLRDSLETLKHEKILAKPYLFDGTIQPGALEYGISASAGIVSTARDLLKFSQALDTDSFLSEAYRTLLFSAPRRGLPYAHGIFSQDISGHQLVWGYGQYDAYSSLFIKIPQRNISLIVLANNNLMSDPARLINGDVRSSLFAQSFLKNFLFDKIDDHKVFQESLEPLAKALAYSFMARFETELWKKSQTILDSVFLEHPEYLDYSGLNVLHNLTFLKTVAFHKELGTLTKYDDKIERMGQAILQKDPNNPYAHVYLGEYYADKDDVKNARIHFEQIVNAKNFSPFWYTSVAKNWLEKNP